MAPVEDAAPVRAFLIRRQHPPAPQGYDVDRSRPEARVFLACGPNECTHLPGRGEGGSAPLPPLSAGEGERLSHPGRPF